MSDKIRIYWDVDDVILNTSEILIDMINKKYNPLKKKTLNNIKDWELRSIYRDIETDFINDALADEYFWSNVTVKKDFEYFLLSGIARKFDHYFVTIGTDDNISLKKEFITKLMERCNYQEDSYIYLGLNEKFSKQVVPMKGGIQIDDNISNLVCTNAKIKILIKNFIETDYNTFNNKNYFVENLYEVNNLKEVIEILEFIIENPSMLQE